MRPVSVARPQALASDVDHWTTPSKIAPFYRIKPIGINNQDKQLLRTNHQFRIGLDNLSNNSSSKANHKDRIRLLVLPSKIGMRKGDRIRHKTGYNSKDVHIILIVWMKTL
ncbi:hypothetical protein AAC387_Pa02g2190 [Persea americana]